MARISYLFPSLRQPRGIYRGGLLPRFEEAVLHGCRYIEIPASFIRSRGEEKETGISVCGMLTRDAIEKLYSPSETIPEGLEYIFHTDPSLSQVGADGVRQPPADLRWHDASWLQQFSEMLIYISERLGAPASIIEIHPGSNQSVSMKDIALAMRTLRQTYGDYFGGRPPGVVLENRNMSIAEDGQQLREFWTALQQHTPELCEDCGIVLDLFVLFNAARRRGDAFEDYLNAVPVEGIMGVHVHTRHHAPSPEDAIPWETAFAKVAGIPHDFFVNPEIHQQSQVRETIAFCKGYLGEGE